MSSALTLLEEKVLKVMGGVHLRQSLTVEAILKIDPTIGLTPYGPPGTQVSNPYETVRRAIYSLRKKGYQIEYAVRGPKNYRLLEERRGKGEKKAPVYLVGFKLRSKERAEELAEALKKLSSLTVHFTEI